MASETKESPFENPRSILDHFNHCCSEDYPDFTKAHSILHQLSKVDGTEYKTLANALLTANPPNDHKALYTYIIRDFASKNNAIALTCVADWYYNGNAVEKNMDRAAHMYKRAADQQYSRAQYMYGKCCMNGNGVVKNIDEAFRMYSLASKQGYVHAHTNLGLCYMKGYGTEKNEAEGFRLFRLAADHNDKNALSHIADCYRDGKGVEKDPDASFRYYNLAADQGHVHAQICVGWCYMRGFGVKTNAEKAFSIYNDAMDKGNNYAMRHVGYCYWYGIGVEKDRSNAIKLYEIAANNGCIDSQFVLGCIYETEDCKDSDKALHYYKLAADQGNEEARRYIDRISYDRNSSTRNLGLLTH